MHKVHVPLNASRADVYEALLPQVSAVVSGESDAIANFANVSAMLKEAFNFFWVGFYRLVESGDLVLGPFQGTLACSRIGMGKGVCGTAAFRQTTIIVSDVEQFEGHIACSSLSRSEIVVPVFKEGALCAVLDIDSTELNDFSEIDAIYLEKIVALL